MLLITVLVASLAVQFVAAFLALRLIKITGAYLAWGLVAAAIALMALRRLFSLERLISSDFAEQPHWLVELMALAISLLMAWGISRITPIFREQRAVTEQLQQSQARYRMTFENSPISIWEEDFSQVKALFDKLRGEGVSDIEDYFARYPEVLQQCVALIQVVDVNRAALGLHGAPSREALLAGLGSTFVAESITTFRQGLIYLWHGQTEMVCDAVVRTLAGERRDVTVYFAVCPGYEASLSKIFVSLVDITGRKHAEQERQAHTEFLAHMDKINRAIQRATDLDTMMGEVLASVLTIFDGDRAFLLHPCDPGAPSWTIAMERYKPEYPGAGGVGSPIPMDPQVAASLSLVLARRGVVTFGPRLEQPLPEAFEARFGIKSYMAIALYPKVGKAWVLGIHQCASARVWTVEEQLLFQEVGWRVTDSLNSLLVQRELRASEEKYRRFVDTAGEGILALGVDLRINFVNAQLAAWLGYTCAEMMGRPATDFMDDADAADHRYRMERRRHLLSEHYERRFRRRNGTLLWAWVSAAAITNEAGEFQGAFAMLTDITERKRTEEQLKFSEARFRLTLEAVNVGVWDWDVAGDYYYASPIYYTMLGYPPHEGLANRHEWLERLHPDDRSLVMEKVQGVLRHQQDHYLYDARFLHADGRYRWMRVIGYGVERDGHGKVGRMLGLRMDIDAQKRAEEELRHYREQLEETVEQRTAELRLARDAAEAANRAKSMFLANMSHELRTPLNAILGFSHMMQHTAGLSPIQYQNLEIINRSGAHLLTLINDVLELAKIESGKLQLDIAPFDLAHMVQDVSHMMQLRAQQKGLQLVLESASELPQYIEGDEARLRQVLVNLVENGIKFSREGQVTIRLGSETEATPRLLIEVEDTGPGIEPQEQQQLFQPFVQAAEGRAAGGTGLGLAVTRQFVQLMGGHIGVESTPGKGSCFRIQLPLTVAKAWAVSKVGPIAHPVVLGVLPGQPTYRILIAEDQQDNQLLLTRLMVELGLETRVANNGEECLRIFEAWQPDLIWMDRRMPVMDGVEATRRIRQLRTGKPVKIIAVTASAFDEEQPEMLASGMDGVIRKPYQFDEIYDCLAQQLGLQFLYQTAAHEAEVERPPLSPQSWTGIDAALRDQLMVAVESLDRERINIAIDAIATIDSGLGKSLSQLAEQFNYPAILASLEAAAERGEPGSAEHEINCHDPCQ